MSNAHIELNDETIYWVANHDWSRMHEDGRMEYGVGVFLPRLAVLQQMATQIAKGELSRVRYFAEADVSEQTTEKDWRELTGWNHPYVHRKNGAITLELEAKLDYTGRLGWSLFAREPGEDGYCSISSTMAPDFALAWFIATAWEFHKEWLSEQLTVTGGLA